MLYFPKENKALCFFHSLTKYFIISGIFDMNAWYQAQMPSLFSVDEGDDLCSYFSHSLLEDPDGASGINI